MSIDRKIQPNILNATDFSFHLAAITQSQLQNGIPFYYLNAGAQEVVNLDITFDAGTWYQPKLGVANAVATLIKNGTSSKSALQINELIEYYGATLKSASGNDLSNINLSCLSKHIHHLLPLVYEIIVDSIFPESELELYKQTTIQRLKISNKKSDFIANRKIDEFLFGYQHPYGTYTNIEDVEKISSAELKTYLSTYFCFNNCKIFLTGKFNENIITEIDHIFGANKWNENIDMQKSNFAIQPDAIKKHRITNDEKGVQGSIRLGMPFIEKAHEDFLPMVIVNTLFGGYFGSRLMANIREEKGYTYGIYSFIHNNKNAGAFGITTEAGKDVCELAIQEIYKEMELLKTEGVDEEELQLVKNYILGGLKGDLDGPFQIMQRWKNILLFGFDKSRFDKSINIYKTITTKQVQELANKYFIAENFYELVVV